jgi:uncharacterized membrane protein HdeD (DUF308 family)
MSSSNSAFDSVEAAAGAGWGWVLGYGLLVIAIGILALLNPVATGFATGILFGGLLVVYGVIAIASGISSLSRRARWIEILLGVLALIAGIAILFMPFAGAWSLVWALGFWLIVSGVFQIASGIQGAYDKAWRLFLGLLDLVLGAILLFASPASSLIYLAAIVGVSFLFRGAFLVSLALALRRFSRGGI